MATAGGLYGIGRGMGAVAPAPPTAGDTQAQFVAGQQAHLDATVAQMQATDVQAQIAAGFAPVPIVPFGAAAAAPPAPPIDPTVLVMGAVVAVVALGWWLLK